VAPQAGRSIWSGCIRSKSDIRARRLSKPQEQLRLRLSEIIVNKENIGRRLSDGKRTGSIAYKQRRSSDKALRIKWFIKLSLEETWWNDDQLH
jgi:hypothetical protein